MSFLFLGGYLYKTVPARDPHSILSSIISSLLYFNDRTNLCGTCGTCGTRGTHEDIRNCNHKGNILSLFDLTFRPFDPLSFLINYTCPFKAMKKQL